MKKGIIMAIISVLISGCASINYYQLFETKSDDLQASKDFLTYENEDLKIMYDFWRENGDGDFYVANKTDKDLFIDLTSSHLIQNGYAQTYFQNRTFTNSFASSSGFTSKYGYGTSTGKGSTQITSNYFGTNVTSQASGEGVYTTSTSTNTAVNGYSVSFAETEILVIPPNSYKVINGFDLVGYIYDDCIQDLYPGYRQAENIKQYSSKNSPFLFQNILCYGFDENLTSKQNIKNQFWVSKITNYGEKQFIGLRSADKCGNETYLEQSYYLYSGPDKFYVKYQKSGW